MGCERMTECVASDMLIDLRMACGGPNRLLQGASAGVVAAEEAASRVAGNAPGGKRILPYPLTAGSWILAFQGIRQVNRSIPEHQILLMATSDKPEMEGECIDEAFRQDGHPILAALAVSHGDFAQIEVDILDP